MRPSYGSALVLMLMGFSMGAGLVGALTDPTTSGTTGIVLSVFVIGFVLRVPAELVRAWRWHLCQHNHYPDAPRTPR